MACDRVVAVNMRVWIHFKEPMAVCGHCYLHVNHGVLFQLFQLRKQVRHLYDVIRAVQEDVDELYESYKDLK